MKITNAMYFALLKAMEECPDTQTEIARKAGISQKHLSNIKNRGVGTVTTYERVLNAMGYKVTFKVEKK